MSAPPPEDAANYVVAACWEFIIPGCAFDVVNIGAMSYPKAVDRMLHNGFTDCKDFDEVMALTKKEINSECEEIMNGIHDLWFVPSPFMGVMLDDIKYRNFGMHGTGIATAADSLAAIKKYVFDEKYISAADMLKAVDENFENSPELLDKLRNEAPKMGCDDDYVDNISVELLDTFADCLEGKKNCEGGVWRAGTGSAMFYLWHAREIGASPDGRRSGEPFGTNFSASLFAKVSGPVSVVKSFTKQHFVRAINGGPLTLEFHNSVFRGEGSLEKVASIVKYFIDRGGHQLQLNAVNLETMKDAQKHPELPRVSGTSPTGEPFLSNTRSPTSCVEVPEMSSLLCQPRTKYSPAVVSSGDSSVTLFVVALIVLQLFSTSVALMSTIM